MKRVLALILTVIMLAGVLVSCGLSRNGDDKGAVINVYLAEKVNSLDPAFAYLSESASKIIGLVFSGLYRLDENGKANKDLCDGNKITEDAEKDYYMMELSIKDTKWNDGRSVSANDFVYAWKRLLEPGFSSEAASLLYEIKNARACKRGDVSIDDVGIYAVETKKLQIVFEQKIDYEQFLVNLASPELVPLREDKASRLANWASYYATMATDGPFFVKIFEPTDSSFILERNQYYFRDAENDNYDKSVTPFRIEVDYAQGKEAALEAYSNGTLFYDASLPLSVRADYEKQVKTEDTPYTYTYVFNTKKAPFDSADVRKGLAMALNREEIANLITFATTAEGFVPGAVRYGTSSGSFRDKAGSVLSESNLEEAKKLVSSAKEKKFTLSVRDNDIDIAVAEYAAGRWKDLGFTVEIEKITYSEDTEAVKRFEYDQFFDDIRVKYLSSDFDVIGVDMSAFTNDAFNTLAPYSPDFSGMMTDFTKGDTVTAGPSGYDNKEYSELIEQAFAEKDLNKRAEILVNAEKKLAEDMPAVPLFVYKEAYLTKKLSGLKREYFGPNFTRVSLSGYKEFTTSPEEL